MIDKYYPYQQRYKILGGPGCGKTTTLVEKIMNKSKFNRVIGDEEPSTNRDYKIKIDQTSLTLVISHKLKKRL